MATRPENSSDATVRSGSFELRLHAGKQVYLSRDLVEVTASLTYLGPGRSTTVHLLGPRGIRFVLAGGVPYASVDAGRGRWGCNEQTLRRGVPLDVPMLNYNDPTIGLSLSANVWDLEASTAIYRTACDGAPLALVASMKLEVRDDINIPMIDLATRDGAVGLCLDPADSGTLVRDPATGLGTLSADGGQVRDVVWPLGFTARVQGGVALLVDRTGRIVAKEGDRVELGGGKNPNNVYVPCDAVRTIPPGDG